MPLDGAQVVALQALVSERVRERVGVLLTAYNAVRSCCERARPAEVEGMVQVIERMAGLQVDPASQAANRRTVECKYRVRNVAG